VQATRRARIESTIKDELSVFIPAEIEDPRVDGVNVTGVQMTEDASHAVIFITVDAPLGSEGETPEKQKKRVEQCLEGLAAAAGFIRKHLAGILMLRHTPSLSFRLDKGFDNAARVHALLREINSKSGS
jgi:ribosome-binding factor A